MNSMRTFEVLRLELDFLDNYYQGGVPVVMSSPWLFFVNYLFSILFVWIYMFLIAVAWILHPCRVNSQDGRVALYAIVSLMLVIIQLTIQFTE
ncbi:hypothetical protein GUJ93_ZPchr0007g3913 [Zizania palustris]|uniref:Uncharacterized protein n=1 Tax=Zizania palustris TaxID=103762 RepID=A0A8J5SVF9_ZIZPA|nr:hypothetical protein GUJ93_ZPchr0007g3913 [Zizania palustris]